VERLIRQLRTVDSAIARVGSWIVGTRWRRPSWRLAAVLVFFGGAALGGVFLPWPGCLWALWIGLVGVLVVFRHWSIHENEAERNVEPSHKLISLDGNLNYEMVIGAACVFLYAPVAFAQIHAAGYRFQLQPDAGSFAFVGYTAIEMLKIGSLIQYYDVFADK